jgi:capsular polysaccharide transport system permease protein
MLESARMLARGLSVQCRVVSALLQLRFLARWGRRNLGFAWLFAEPLVFALPVIVIWTMVRAPYEHGLPMTAFVWSGYLPILIFRHVTGGAIYSFRDSTSLFYHRQVNPLDVFLGNQGLEAVGNLSSAVFSFLVFYAIGLLDGPVNYQLMLLGFVYTTWWSLAVALIVSAAGVRSEVVEHIWQPVSYLYMFFSGFMFMAAWLPHSLRQIALTIDPPLICYEIIRAGMFGNKVQTYYDIPYLTYILLVLTFIGLFFVRDVRKHLELQ